MTHATSPIQLSGEVRAAWATARQAQESGRRMTVALTGIDAARAAQGLAALTGVETTVFSASGVTGRADWYSIEVETPREGLPDGTRVTSRRTYRLPTLLVDALTRPGPRIVIIQDLDDVPADAIFGRRGALDEFPGSNPQFSGSVAPDVQVILAVTALSPQARHALEGRIDVFIELDRSTAQDMAAG